MLNEDTLPHRLLKMDVTSSPVNFKPGIGTGTLDQLNSFLTKGLEMIQYEIWMWVRAQQTIEKDLLPALSKKKILCEHWPRSACTSQQSDQSLQVAKDTKFFHAES